MTNTILILLLIHYIGFLFLSKNDNILACGLFGYLGKSANKFNKDKFDKLGIYNEKRGTDSCGVTLDGEIVIGTGSTKVYKDFIVSQPNLSPTKFPYVFGHTRSSSFGAHTIDNAHPFGFGTNKDSGFKFIGVHNGTLLNHTELAAKYDIPLQVSVKKNSKRTKIDSEVLLEIIYKTKKFKVLSEYNGAAALIFADNTNPNTVYCYHGSSKLYESSASETEERPLYYYRVNKNNMYISSIKESLYSIGGTVDTIKSFETNVIYKITDGNIDKAEKTKISRKGNHQRKTRQGSFSYGNYGSNYDAYEDYGSCSSGFVEKNKKEDVKPYEKKILEKPDYLNLIKENIDVNKYKGKVYFHQLRYQRNGHLITGIYTWIPKFGYYYLGDEIQYAKKTFKSFNNLYFHKGDFVKEAPKDSIIPFKNYTGNLIPMFFFHNGIRLKEHIDYLQVRSGEFTIKQLSFCSKHAIIDVKSGSNIVYEEGIKKDGIISPLGADKIYEFKLGKCISIKDIYKKESTITKSLTVVHPVKEEKTKEDSDKENDLLNEELATIFTKNYRDFPRYIKRLKRYKDLEKGQHAINILKNFIKETTNLIAVEPQN